MRLHLIQRGLDLGKVRVVIHLFPVKVLKLIPRIRDVLRVNRKIDRAAGGHSIPYGDRPVGGAGLLPVPFRTHHAGGTEDAVNLLLVTPAPERQHGKKAHIRI